MERKRHLKLVNGLSRVFGNSDKGKAQAKGRAGRDSTDHVILLSGLPYVSLAQLLVFKAQGC